MKVLIINFWSRLNKGSTILVDVLIELLNKCIPDKKCIDYILHSYYKDYNRRDVIERDSIFKGSRDLLFKMPIKLTIVPIFILLRCFIYAILNRYLGLRINRLIKEERLQDYYKADIVIPTGGDSLSEGSRFKPIVFLNFLNILFAILLDRPIIIIGESIGPFSSRLNKFMAQTILNKVKLIILRDEMSRKYLEDIGINKPLIYVTADLAFLLEPVSEDRIKQILSSEGIDKKNRLIIGISPSSLIFDEKHYFIIAKFADHLIDVLNATIVFISHVMMPKYDDRVTAYEIYKLMKNKERAILIRNEYTPEELKGIIGQCNLFIGARMHSTIASTSMLVPTIGIMYSHKMYGILGKMLELEKYIIDIKELSYETLISKINILYKNRESIREHLKVKISEVKEKAKLNEKLIKESLDSCGAR